MGNRLPYTPNSKIKNALRILWMRCRERVDALKNTGYRCSMCGVKQSRAKGKEVYLDVHHVDHVVNWQRIYDVIREELLIPSERLAPLCDKCHAEIDENKHLKKEEE